MKIRHTPGIKVHTAGKQTRDQHFTLIFKQANAFRLLRTRAAETAAPAETAITVQLEHITVRAPGTDMAVTKALNTEVHLTSVPARHINMTGTIRNHVAGHHIAAARERARPTITQIQAQLRHKRRVVDAITAIPAGTNRKIHPAVKIARHIQGVLATNRDTISFAMRTVEYTRADMGAGTRIVLGHKRITTARPGVMIPNTTNIKVGAVVKTPDHINRAAVIHRHPISNIAAAATEGARPTVTAVRIHTSEKTIVAALRGMRVLTGAGIKVHAVDK